MYRGVLGALEREGDGRGERERGENARRGAVGALLAERVLADFCRLVHFACGNIKDGSRGRGDVAAPTRIVRGPKKISPGTTPS